MKLFKLISISMILISSFNQSFGQQVTERYVNILDHQKFLSYDETENNYYVRFELNNIYENESSKPIYVAVNELQNVISFSIKSKSFEKENQRTCFLRIKPENYAYTLYFVFKNMNVKYIFDGEKYIEIEKYFAENFKL
jgi:hypothetical protein